MKKPKMYVASCSFGKDSLATILLALEHNEPLDRVVFSEIMFDHEKGISGEIPEHIQWIREVAIPKLESMGVKVDVVRSKKDYVTLCRTKWGNRSKRYGRYRGVTSGPYCWVNSDVKISGVKTYLKELSKNYDITLYVGIAIDEPKRLVRLKGTNRVSLLEKYGYTEVMAMEKCREYNLVSPCYTGNWGGGQRQGCWFCYNAPLLRYIHIRKDYPEYWQALRDLYYETDSLYFKYGLTLKDIEQKMDAKENQLKLF